MPSRVKSLMVDHLSSGMLVIPPQQWLRAQYGTFWSCSEVAYNRGLKSPFSSCRIFMKRAGSSLFSAVLRHVLCFVVHSSSHDFANATCLAEPVNVRLAASCG